MDELKLDYVRARVVLVAGAAGTIDSVLVRQLLPIAKAVRCLDHSETQLFFLHQRLHSYGAMAPQLGDIRDLDGLRFAMNGVDVVLDTAVSARHRAMPGEGRGGRRRWRGRSAIAEAADGGAGCADVGCAAARGDEPARSHAGERARRRARMDDVKTVREDV